MLKKRHIHLRKTVQHYNTARRAIARVHNRRKVMRRHRSFFLLEELEG